MTQVPQAVPDLIGTARELSRAMTALVEAVPGSPHKPTPLATQLGLSRVTVSNLLRALRCPSPLEVLEAIPGPESLRAATAGAVALSVEPAVVSEANAAIDAFAGVIRDHFGTRAALRAAIRPHSGRLRERVDTGGRTDVFNGMRQILGVEARTWVTSMLFVPSTQEPGVIAVTTIHGALALRRLRPDTQVYFTFGPPQQEPGDERELSASRVALHELYLNQPATLETMMVGGRLRHRLVQDQLGKDAVADMLAVSHDARGSRRYAAEGARLRGVSLFVDVPVRRMVCDAIVHESLFPGQEARLIAYNPGARGPANPNDPTRDLDRVDVSERPELVLGGSERFQIPEVPNYPQMIERVCRQIGIPAEQFRVHRVVMAYPVTAFQFVIAFEAPPPPPPPVVAPGPATAGA